MVLDRQSGRREHRGISALPEILEKGSLLVFNNSRVRRARITARSKETGGAAEFLLLEKLDEYAWTVMVRRARRRRPGSPYVVLDRRGEEIAEAEIAPSAGELPVLRFDRPIGEEWLETYGHIPLPPYIRRKDTQADGERYQTVYARHPGSAAAPTAGLHFSLELLGALKEAGVESVFITLHVGLGTFLPVRVENIEDHVMHREVYRIDEETASRIRRARSEGRKIIAVGTTSLRTLETAWKDGGIEAGEGVTSLFIYPGYSFRAVDGLITNFHTPGSTLLMLTAAFAEARPAAFTGAQPGNFTETKGPAFAGLPSGRELILESYREAVQEGYRFFSYGDAMFIR
jgi:S-adenosylmethionine:tRNA ribosyltransferase-isomerase